MSKVDVVEILKKSDALLEGHFLLSSGKHSNRYVQCAKVLRFPQYAEQVLSTVVEQIKDLDIDLVVGPAMGGVIVSYELGRQLNKEAVFTERKDGVMQLRRGFEVKPGAKIIISEDVVTTGKSTLETKKALEELGVEYKVIKPHTPKQNGKVERSHRKDQERFYYKRVFYGLEDLRNQGKEWRKEYNNFPMRPLGWLSPREFIKKYKSQEESLFAI